MKKKIAILMACVMVFMVALSACGGGNDYVGTWKLTKMESQGMEISMEDYYMEMSIVLEEDGKAELRVSGEEPEEAQWKSKDDVVTITSDDDDDQILIREGNTLTMEMDDITYHFEKQ